MTLTVGDIGEIRLIDEILLPDVSGSTKGDDCALLSIGAEQLLWSIDPCPTPVVALLGDCPPETWGHYTAAINLSDLAACGGTPIGMLVSLEMPDDTEIAFIRGFQNGLLDTLNRSGARLLGGNVKSAAQFRATGTIIGVAGKRHVTRMIDAPDVSLFIVGSSGSFWAAVVGQYCGWADDTDEARARLLAALHDPRPQTEAGTILGALPFVVACMDCSDGVGSAAQQLATANELDIELEDAPNWASRSEAKLTLAQHGYSLENACYHFGDWQLACLVEDGDVPAFKAAMSDMPLSLLGRGRRGRGDVRTGSGRQFAEHVMNKNFSDGYNSIANTGDLLDRFVYQSVFD
jgi:thiamine-monophosphate kinase